MNLTGKNLIGANESTEGASTFQAIDPSSGKELDTVFTEATENEVDHAVKLASRAFSQYKQTTPEERAAFLDAIAEEILNTGEILIQRCMSETALPEARLNGERMRTVNQLKLFASLLRDGSWVNARIDTAIPDRQPLPKPDIRQIQVPLGPVGVFGASNFPLAFSVAGGDTASALAAGCPVVVKAHPLHPGTSEIVGKAILKAAENTNMPDGVFSMIQGMVDPGIHLVKHPLLTAVGFTGSFGGGKALFDIANKREVPIPVYAEMGSSNPVFLLPGALKERTQQIASGLAGSVNLGVGQFCTNPGLVISEKSKEQSEFVEMFRTAIGEQQPGYMLSGGMKNNFTQRTDQLAKNSVIEKVAAGPHKDGAVNMKAFSVAARDFLQDEHLAEEVFGPSTLLVQADEHKEILRIAESLEGHLTATIHGTEKDLEEYSDLIDILEQKVGRIIFNGYPTGVEVCPSMIHGGPYPATTAPQTTSVGTAAIYRFTRPVCYQNFPQKSLPMELQDANPRGIMRLINGTFSDAAL